jgi:2-polyprenyl-6-methoxyphenol hydroxylase-like FAD-dependent oxidoreductase
MSRYHRVPPHYCKTLTPGLGKRRHIAACGFGRSAAAAHWILLQASVNRQELGWLVEVWPLLERLWQRLEAHPKVQIVLGATQSVTPGQHGVVLTLQQAQAGAERTSGGAG